MEQEKRIYFYGRMSHICCWSSGVSDRIFEVQRGNTDLDPPWTLFHHIQETCSLHQSYNDPERWLRSSLSEWHIRGLHISFFLYLRNKEKKAHMVPRWQRIIKTEPEFLHLLAAALDWSGIKLGNCALLSCRVCLDSATEEDYSASSRRPRLEGSVDVLK